MQTFWPKWLFQILFHVCFCGPCHFWLKRWILGSLPLILARLLWWLTWIGHGRRDTPPFPRLGWKKTWSSLYWFSQNTCPQNPDTMLWGSPSPIERHMWCSCQHSSQDPSPRLALVAEPIVATCYHFLIPGMFSEGNKGVRWFISRWIQPPAIKSPAAYESSQLTPPPCPCLNYWPTEHMSLVNGGLAPLDFGIICYVALDNQSNAFWELSLSGHSTWFLLFLFQVKPDCIWGQKKAYVC